MVASSSPSSSATRSAEVAGAWSGAPPGRPPPLLGLPELDWALLDAELLAEALLEAELLAEVLEEELLEEEDALCSSSEKSTSSGGCPWSLLEGSGGIALSCGCCSESLYAGLAGFRLRVLGSGEASLADLLRCRDSSPLLEAVLVDCLDSLLESIVGIDVLGRLLLGMLGLGLLEELLDGVLLLAVCGWLRLDELLLDEELD